MHLHGFGWNKQVRAWSSLSRLRKRKPGNLPYITYADTWVLSQYKDRYIEKRPKLSWWNPMTHLGFICSNILNHICRLLNYSWPPDPPFPHTCIWISCINIVVKFSAQFQCHLSCLYFNASGTYCVCSWRRSLHYLHRITLHRLISANVGQWVTSHPAKLPILPGRKMLSTDAVEYNPKVSKGKTPVSVKFVVKIQQIYMFQKVNSDRDFWLGDWHYMFTSPHSHVI